ncbi:septal ring lytic transglycosylase RlpA family protein [Acidovorax sp. NCPPB 3859]|nr:MULTISPECIES: septal ring lytic transglycosylase RlpA family protein [unclassified Acidovorax]MDA8457849.1 septal ring lytic transglycosylase RlpA family protein [Acidovorax sp. GBBC 3333]MDA8462627.1 septal ring lytic transglycosylase RlpA family protein [Acidovorax sp. GBBC 3332]MDA8467919.1 septal ring lytic transglycosylase RlpA family protein [Acidovorax sp. GBBC 3299]WCM77931.1 septal ring lytic transglycosylase RlpA family protein [Acidovorax sp. GBBC 712]WCM82824.1 septal ring lytic
MHRAASADWCRPAGRLAISGLCALVAACAVAPAPGDSSAPAAPAPAPSAQDKATAERPARPAKRPSRSPAPAPAPAQDAVAPERVPADRPREPQVPEDERSSGTGLDLNGELAGFGEEGMASWYGARFHSRRTASGERFDMNDFTAAHRTLPFGTRVCVRSLVTGRSVQVRINDRGPHSPGRIVDLSRAAAQSLGLLGLGIKPVAISLAPADPDAPCPGSRDDSVAP